MKKQIKQLFKDKKFFQKLLRYESRNELAEKAKQLEGVDKLMDYIEHRMAIVSQDLMMPSTDREYKQGRVFELLDIRKDLLLVMKDEEVKKPKEKIGIDWKRK